jgi:small ligand-binding sensory domain FIST
MTTVHSAELQTIKRRLTSSLYRSGIIGRSRDRRQFVGTRRTGEPGSVAKARRGVILEVQGSQPVAELAAKWLRCRAWPQSMPGICNVQPD